MICQHCQTQDYDAVILDDDYRCRRCGRRVRSTPARPVTNRFAVETTSVARAYSVEYESEWTSPPITQAVPESQDEGQSRLFEAAGSDSRVIAFESLTTPSERQSIQARAAGLNRPAPLKAEKIQLRHARPAKARSTSRTAANDQRRLQFDGEEGILPRPCPSIICDALVAPAWLRFEATLIDLFIIAIPCGVTLALFTYVAGSPVHFFSATRFFVPLLLASLATIPVFYKLVWAFAGRDSIGMQRAGLQLVDFDGNPPSRGRRFQRFFSGLLGLFAAGIGLIWALVDEDRLTWHDHISNTFPTVLVED